VGPDAGGGHGPRGRILPQGRRFSCNGCRPTPLLAKLELQIGASGLPMRKLTIVDEEGTRTVLPLSRGEYAIGRDPENTIRLTERNISRKHMVLRRDQDDAWVVEDLNSYNGCFINGLRVAGTQPLSDGDLLQLGDYRLELVEEKRPEEGASEQVSDSAPSPRTSRLLDRPDRFVVVEGPGAGTEYPLDRERMIIGRAEDADVSINHNSVSRIHAELIRIAPGSYEIVDRGSSNGIRVNATKLDRRVIEDDDEIELGDVRMRFVCQGRIFRPGSPRVSTSFAPAATTTDATPKRQLGMMIGAGALLGLLCVVGFVALRPKPDPTGNIVSAASADDPHVIIEAKRLEAAGDLDAAHAKLTAEIPETSALRDSPELKRIEATWADAQLQRAAAEPDAVKKRALLNQVASAKFVDVDRRKRAADELQKLETGGTDINLLPTATAAKPDAATSPALPEGLAPNPFEPSTGRPDTDKTKGKTPPVEKTAPTATDPGGNEKARELMAQGSDGESKARKMLEPRVWSGRATADEVRYLKAICKHQKDAACVARANAMLQDMLKNQ
jgi:ABC transport system ATP-binding/permease protein